MERLIVKHFHLGGYAVAKIQKKYWTEGPNGGIWKLTGNPAAADWTGHWVTVGVVALRRTAGYQTQLDLAFQHAAAGSWNSGKPNMSVAQLKWQRKRSDQGTWTDIHMDHAQSGEWGVQVTNFLTCTDTGTAEDAAGTVTQYRLVARKANIVRHQNMSPYLDNFRVEMTHFKQAD